MSSRRTLLVALALLLSAPALMGADGEGCGPALSMTPAPDMEGTWDVTYDDVVGVEVSLGGAIYTEEIGLAGGAFTIEHEGVPIVFDLDCTRPELVCPSEVYPSNVTIEQRNTTYPHRIYMELPFQSCDGELLPAEPTECGDDTLNPDCEDVCMGEVVTTTTPGYGVIDEPGETYSVLLGAGVATNGVNCALLGVSGANGDLVNTGTEMGADWETTGIENGEVVVAYAGGCLWAGDIDDDGTIEAAVAGAGLRFTTGYTATKRM